MLRPRLLLAALCCALLVPASVATAQGPRPYHDGSAWAVTFVHVKAGMDTAYLSYLATDWKKEQEALKSEGLILSYKVIGFEGHSPTDFNLMLMTEYKSLAAMEASSDKEEALAQKLFGSDQKVIQGYKDRLEIREIVGDRLGREIVLEPKK
jgi:hypothetical protein